MGWCRQCCALITKNRRIKCRQFFSTVAEILLPVLVMLIIVGLRAAVTKDDNPSDLHLDSFATLNNNVTAANIYNNGEKSRGAAGVQSIQFVGPHDDPKIIAMYDDFKAMYPVLSPLVQQRFANDKELDKYVQGSDYATSSENAAVFIAVSFQSTDSLAGWQYSIRGNASRDVNRANTLITDEPMIDRLNTKFDDDYSNLFLEGGHILLQDFVETWILEHEGSGSPTVPARDIQRTISFQPFPTRPYIDDPFADVVSAILGLFFTIIYIWPVTRLVKGIVEEKQLRIREGMKMMGLPDSALFCSWLTTYTVMFLITAIGITIVTASTVYENSNKFFIFIFFFFFAMTTFAFCWLLSVFFSRAQVATTMAALAFLALFFVYFGVQDSTTSTGAKYGACIIAQVCFGLGAVVIQKLESSSTGVIASSTSTEVDNWSYSATIGMFVIDFFLYLLLALYFQQVMPSEWGTHQKWYFCFQPKFWCPKEINTSKRGQGGETAEMGSLPHRALSPNEAQSLVSAGAPGTNGGSVAANRSHYFEPVADAVRENLGVSIQHLHKRFHTDGEAEPFIAVKDMNLDLYSGQILALLGHNGAGKTTTINMMTGMIAPTSGDALVYGSSIRDNMSAVRQILGVCPQHDILFGLLTVREHLELFAAIKGVPKEDTERQINEMIEQVGLTEKVNDKSAALSGGMQRKLSVGIALLGDSKIVFLDEPTSGMDPYSRRATWDLLKKKKEGRVIILTTHFMDEADQLGDRIAIMAKGDVKCCGSSLFLKGRYGVGYTLTITKQEGKGFNEREVSHMITSAIPDVSQLSNIAGEISYRLPFQSSAHFADVFDAFDQRQNELGIAGYGISVTTLEEVFLRVGHEEEGDAKAGVERKRQLAERQRSVSRSEQESPDAPPTDLADLPLPAPQVVIHHSPSGAGEEYKASESEHAVAATPSGMGSPGGSGDVIHVKPSPRTHKPDGDEPQKHKLARHGSSRFANLKIPGEEVSMLWPHFRALFIKRWINAKRDRKVWTWTLVYPFLILLIGCGLIKLTQKTTSASKIIDASALKQGTVNFVPFTAGPGSLDIFTTGDYLNTNFQVTPLANVTAVNASSTATDQYAAAAMNQYLFDQVYPDPLQEYSRYNAFTYATEEPPSGGLIDRVVVYFNSTAQFATALGLNMYNSQLLRHYNSNAPPIKMSLHPLPQTLNQGTLVNSITAVIVAIGFAFMPANFIAFAVKEDQDKVKHQQLISGVSAMSYWGANYAWDFCNYMVMGLLCLLIFRIWDISELLGSNTGATFISIVLYGLSVIPFNYMCSFAFSESTSAQNSMLLFYIFAGALLLIAMLVLGIIESTKDIASHLRWVCRLIPSYCFGECIANIIVRESPTAFGEKAGLWELRVVGNAMFMMAWEIVAYSAIVLLIEYVKATPSLLTMLTGNPSVEAENKPDEDEDVIAEKQRLQSGQGSQDSIRITGLRKVYKGRLGGGNKIAVQDLWLGIPQGQCFGYLGINGAGKTTTLKMLTADIIPTSGTAQLHGLDILKQQNDVRRLLGYCPQFDALLPLLTAREHLALFARIKGVPEELIPDYCEHLILRLGLQEGIADKPTRGYSGGNKRKLCVGIALIGNPPVVFLDEPSTGMDPGSRRFMWDLIASTMKHRSVILTTHSMEECEALCGRIGIMVGGRLRCLGSTTRLKNVYGNGYQLDVNVASGPAQEGFKAELSENWPEVLVLEAHGDSLKFRLPRENHGQRTTIGQVFRFMEHNKQRFAIREYACSETSLEQIFIAFAKTQDEEKGHVAGL